VTGSASLALLLTFARDIGLFKQLEHLFSPLKYGGRGYSLSARVLSFLPDLNFLRSEPGLWSLFKVAELMMRFPVEVDNRY